MSSTKRLLAMLFAFAMVAAACGGSSDSTEAGDAEASGGDEASAASGDDCSSDEVLCIGLVTDVGKVDDRSFNQSAWEGAQGSVADHAEYIETQNSKDYATNIQTFLDQDYDVIVTVGFALGEATGIAAKANPEVSFIGVDQFQGEVVENYAGLIFAEDKAGFMAGALAGLLTESNHVGAIGGTDLVPPVVAFVEGVRLGAEYVNADATVSQAYHPGGMDVAFSDPTWGANTARQMLDQGADVIFAGGGSTGNGALSEIAKDGGEFFCIGVDTDQWNTVPDAQPCLISSAMKLIVPGVQDLVAQAKGGSMAGGNFVGDVGLAPYHDFADTIPQDVQDQVAEISAALLDGSLETGFAP